MINLRFLLGLYPSTEKIEEKEKALIKKFEQFETIRNSEELKRYYELKAFIESPDFQQKRKEIELLDFKKTEAYQKEKEYLQLKNSKRIVIYYKMINHPLYENYIRVKDSVDLQKYFELKAYVESEEFLKRKEELKKLTYKNSKLYAQEHEFQKLSRSNLIKNYYKVLHSAEYENYRKVEGSSILERYKELKAIVESEDFRKKEAKIKKERFKDTKEYTQWQEYHQLRNNKKLKVYLTLIQSDEFATYKELEESDELKTYIKLKTYITSKEFLQLKADKKSFEGSDAEQKLKEWNQLSHQSHFKTYEKFITSRAFTIYNEIKNSSILKRYEELEALISSPAFIDVQNYFQLSSKERWKRQSESKIKDEYLLLSNDPSISDYLKFIQSKEFKLFKEADTTGIVAKYEELKKIVESPTFHKEKEYLLLPFEEKWKQTDDYSHFEEYIKLSSDEHIKQYFKFISLNDYKIFEEVNKTNEIPYFEELQKYIQSNDFINYKEYMLLPFKQKWEKTEEHIKENEYKKLMEDEKIKWYLKIKDTHEFDELKRWKLTFFDDFNNDHIDANLWLTKYYWGDSILKDSYSLSNELHFNTDGKNIILRNSRLIIETRKEQVEGKAWNPMLGFVPKTFDYTSGLINTGKSFRQQYGRFCAKILMPSHPSITGAFWMVGNRIIPHIDIAKYAGRKIWMNTFWGDLTVPNGIRRTGTSLFSIKPSKKEYIYELRWTPNELIWYINGLEIYRTKEGIPNEPMYLQLSSSILNETGDNHFPVIMEIDWVKCYQEIKE